MALHQPSSRPACQLKRCCSSQIFMEAAADAWAETLIELNAAPVFALSADLKLMQYEREDADPLVHFFADIDRAISELSKARSKDPALNLSIMPVGLGNAYDQMCRGKALIVPGAGELAQAQDMQLTAAPEALGMLESAGIEAPVVKWDRDVLPIFGCFRILRRRADGSRFTPLFMASVDAQEAFDKACAAAPERAASEGFEIECVPLPKVVELAQLKEGPSLRVVPPAESVLYLQGKSAHT